MSRTGTTNDLRTLSKVLISYFTTILYVCTEYQVCTTRLGCGLLINYRILLLVLLLLKWTLQSRLW
jgi:hypothetical protein